MGPTVVRLPSFDPEEGRPNGAISTQLCQIVCSSERGWMMPENICVWPGLCCSCDGKTHRITETAPSFHNMKCANACFESEISALQLDSEALPHWDTGQTLRPQFASLLAGFRISCRCSAVDRRPGEDSKEAEILVRALSSRRCKNWNLIRCIFLSNHVSLWGWWNIWLGSM